MLESFFFFLGLVNSLLLILLFLVRRKRLDLMRRFGWTYLLLAIPALYGLSLAPGEEGAARYGIFLGIFLGFLFLEWLIDYALKIEFRENMKKHLGWVVPYLAFYYAMNYGFIVMPWKTSPAWGILMLGLFVIQLAANLKSHNSPASRH